MFFIVGIVYFKPKIGFRKIMLQKFFSDAVFSFPGNGINYKMNVCHSLSNLFVNK